MMTILRLIYEFFKTGLFAVGGGLATLPFLYEMGEKTGWFTAEDVLNLLAVSESTPGAIGINMSTYVGFTQGGVPGAVVATLGLVTPSVIIILIVALFLKTFRNNRKILCPLFLLTLNTLPAHSHIPISHIDSALMCKSGPAPFLS